MDRNSWTTDNPRALADARNAARQLQARRRTSASNRSTQNQLTQIRSEQRQRYARRDHKIDGKRNGVQVIPTGVLDGRIGKVFPRTRNTLPRGFPAGDNRCYRNAILQCVFHTPEFYHLLGNIHKNCSRQTDECLTCSIQYMAKSYWDGGDGLPEQDSRSKELGAAIKRVFTDFSDQDVVTGRQSDPYFLMANFARYIEKDVTGRDPNNVNDPPVHEAEVNSNNFTVNSVFNFDYAVKWTCQDCGDVKPVEREKMYGLDIKFNAYYDGMTVEQYLMDSVMSPLFEVNPYRCESEACIAQALEPGYQIQPQMKTRHIVSAPEILVVRLGRVKDEQTIFKQKVNYGEILDLSHYSNSGETIRYKLRGIVEHVGSTDYGHYTANVLSRWGGGHTGSYYCHINESAVDQPTDEVGILLDPQDTDVYVSVYSRLLNS